MMSLLMGVTGLALAKKGEGFQEFCGIFVCAPFCVVCGAFWISCLAQDESQEGAFSVTICIMAIIGTLFFCVVACASDSGDSDRFIGTVMTVPFVLLLAFASVQINAVHTNDSAFLADCAASDLALAVDVNTTRRALAVDTNITACQGGTSFCYKQTTWYGRGTAVFGIACIAAGVLCKSLKRKPKDPEPSTAVAPTAEEAEQREDAEEEEDADMQPCLSFNDCDLSNDAANFVRTGLERSITPLRLSLQKHSFGAQGLTLLCEGLVSAAAREAKQPKETDKQRSRTAPNKIRRLDLDGVEVGWRSMAELLVA